ncbi:MAG: DUF881 domain-containing protein [Tetrasphaera sp.]
MTPRERDRLGGAAPASTAAIWRRLARMASPRLTRANLFVTALATLLGFAIATQVQANRTQPLETLREDELVRVLEDVTQNGQRLGAEVRELERTRDALRNSASDSTAALDTARERADALGILAGTVPAIGPGIQITITDPGHKVTSTLLLDAVQELRDAGAEAIQLGEVRVVASTALTDADGGVLAAGETVSAPYSLWAIGDSATLASAMEIPGGVVESVQRLGGTADVRPRETVRITALASRASMRHAAPASPSGSPTT